MYLSIFLFKVLLKLFAFYLVLIQIGFNLLDFVIHCSFFAFILSHLLIKKLPNLLKLQHTSLATSLLIIHPSFDLTKSLVYGWDKVTEFGFNFTKPNFALCLHLFNHSISLLLSTNHHVLKLLHLLTQQSSKVHGSSIVTLA